MKEICQKGYNVKNKGILIRLRWVSSLNEFVIDFSNKNKTIHVPEDTCKNQNLKNILNEFNSKKDLQIFKSIKLIDNENRYLVFSTNNNYEDIELVGLYNDILDLNKISLIDELDNHRNCFKELKSFKFKKKKKIERNYVEVFNEIKCLSDIKKYNMSLDGKNNQFNICLTNKVIKKNNLKRIQASYKINKEKNDFFIKNKNAIDLVSLDFNIQNYIVKFSNCNLYFYLKEKNIFVKIKANKSQLLQQEKKEYDYPLTPMSF